MERRVVNILRYPLPTNSRGLSVSEVHVHVDRLEARTTDGHACMRLCRSTDALMKRQTVLTWREDRVDRCLDQVTDSVGRQTVETDRHCRQTDSSTHRQTERQTEDRQKDRQTRVACLSKGTRVVELTTTKTRVACLSIGASLVQLTTTKTRYRAIRLWTLQV